MYQSHGLTTIMHILLIIVFAFFYQENGAAGSSPTLRCNGEKFITNNNITILSPGYPREESVGNCTNYYPFHTNSSIIAFEIDDFNLYYTNYGHKVCRGTAMFGGYSVPCTEAGSTCLVFTNDRYCLSDGLPKKYYQCMTLYKNILYVPVHLRLQGGHGTEAECVNKNEPRSSCRKIYRLTYPRGLKMTYKQMNCQQGLKVNQSSVAIPSSSVLSTSPKTTAVQDRALEAPKGEKPDLVSDDEQNDRGRFAILFSVIGVSVLLLVAIIVGLTRRYRFKNKRARKRMVRNQGSTATMVNSVIYGSTPDFPSTTPTPDFTSISALEVSNNNVTTDEGDYCYIDFDIKNNDGQRNFKFACQYRRDGVSYIPPDERNNALYEEARSCK